MDLNIATNDLLLQVGLNESWELKDENQVGMPKN